VQKAYGNWKSDIEVPLSTAMSNGALIQSTVFDMTKNDSDKKTLQRVRVPYEQYCAWLDNFYVAKWEAA
jgi:chromosome partitioning protein